MVAGMLTACGGGSGGRDDKPPPVVSDIHTITVEAGANGRISPDSNVTVNPGNTAAFTVTPGHRVSDRVRQWLPAKLYKRRQMQQLRRGQRQ